MEVVALDEQAADGEQRQLRVLPDLQLLQVLGGWVHTLHIFTATWSLLVEKTCWKVESPMSGVIPTWARSHDHGHLHYDHLHHGQLGVRTEYLRNEYL